MTGFKPKLIWPGCTFLIVPVLLAAVCLWFTLPVIASLTEIQLMRMFPQNYTDPLPDSIVQYLCNLLKLHNEDSRCSGKVVYAYEFFPELRQRYNRWDSQEQVDNGLGQFLISCGDPVETYSDGTFRSCEYDFLGDGAFTITIKFAGGISDPEKFTGVVWSVCTYNMQNDALGANFACNPPLNGQTK